MNRVELETAGVDSVTRSKVSGRYNRITRAVNGEFWGSQSEIEHTLQVGSYGRGTATSASDLDVLVSLPRAEYERYDAYRGTGQSRLLQAVKAAVSATYPRTSIRADGQVVVVDFSDGVKFELLPAFARSGWSGEGFDYPDSNMGGRWLSTNPRAEQAAMKEKNDASNGLLLDTCKHMRKIHAERFSSYKLSGIVIDSFVYYAMGDWRWIGEGDGPAASPGAYENVLLDAYNTRSANGLFAFSLLSPGSNQPVDVSRGLECLGKVLRVMAE